MWYLRCPLSGEALPTAWDHRRDAIVALAGSELLRIEQGDLMAGWFEGRHRRLDSLAKRAHPPQHPVMVRAARARIGMLERDFHAGRLPRWPT